MKYMTNAELMRQYGEFIKTVGEGLMTLSERLALNPINLYPLDDSDGQDIPPAEETDAPEKAPAVTDAPEVSQPLSLEDVRAVLMKLLKVKGNDAVRNILNRFGAEKLSVLSPESYAAVIKEAEEMENAAC